MSERTLEQEQIAEINRLLPAWFEDKDRPSIDAPTLTALLHVINKRIDTTKEELVDMILQVYMK